MRLLYIEGVPHWQEGGVLLPVMAGGDGNHPPPLSPQQHQSFHSGDTGLPPGATTFVVDGETFIRLADGRIIRDVGEPAPTPDRGFAPLAPPAFSGTQAGIGFQAEQDRLLAAQGDAAALERLRVSEAGALRRNRETDRVSAAIARLQSFTSIFTTRLQESGAFRRLQAQIGSDEAISQFEQSEAFRRQVLSEVSAGARAEIEQAGADRRTLLSELSAGARTDVQEAGSLQRSLLGEFGAGARGDIEAFTAQRGQSIGAVQDTFNRLSDLATSPSDFRRLAFNVEGIQPTAATATDTLRDRMAQFFQQQVDFAGREPQQFADIFDPSQVQAAPTFGETFGGLQEQFPTPEAESFGDVFNRAQQQVPIPAAASLQFGGVPKTQTSIVGEKGPELAIGAKEIIPNLSAGELNALRQGGVGGAQFGDTTRRDRQTTFGDPSRLTPTSDPTRTATTFGPPLRQAVTTNIAPTGNVAPAPIGSVPPPTSGIGVTGGRRDLPLQLAAPPFVPPAVRQSEPFFNRIGAGQVPAFSPLAFNTPGRTASGFDAPTLPSLRQFNALLPFQREQLFGAFGESVFGPNQFNQQGFDPLTATPVRAGFDPSSVLAAIRRFSPIGTTPQMTRFG